MKTMQIANTELCVPQIALGCMRLGDRGLTGQKRLWKRHWNWG